MSTIHIRKAHNLGYARARRAAERLAREIETRFHASHRWDKDDLWLSRRGVEGRIHIADDAVEVRIKLGMPMRPLKGTIQDSVEKRLSRLLRDDSTVA